MYFESIIFFSKILLVKVLNWKYQVTKNIFISTLLKMYFNEYFLSHFIR